MATNYYSTPQQIIEQLDPEYFKPYQDSILETLNALHQNKPFAVQVDLAGKCLRLFWERYARKQIANIFEAFPRIQRALFGLEEDRTDGTRYRDHYLHMLDVFITGSRILSLAINSIPKADQEEFIKRFFNTTREPADFPFPRPYTAKQRLFFLWTIISTFHDIGIPIEHLEKIRLGLNKFLKYFGLSLVEFQLNHRAHVTSQLGYYFDTMSKFFAAGIRPNENLTYALPEQGDPYLWHALANSFGENNHGVISSICLFNSYEETFLIGHHEVQEYDLTKDKYADFISRVLEQDIARAALAISIHSLDSDIFPKLFPIDSKLFPLTFLLILCDEIQEPFRHEGITFTGISKLTRFPELRLKVRPRGENIHLSIRICYVRLTENEERNILDAAKTWGKSKGIAIPDGYPQFLAWTWEKISTTLQKKLLLSTGIFTIEIHIFLEQSSKEKGLIYERDFSS